MRQVRALLRDEQFKVRHRTQEKYFTWTRALTFPLMILLVLQKSVKGMQLVLNEFFGKLKCRPVSSSAFTQARQHMSHTAFIELNQQAVVKICCSDGDYQRYRGFCMLGIDGSKVHLPDTPAIRAAFGTVDHHPEGGQPQAFALASVVYDLLNWVALDVQLVEGKAYEVDLAFQQLERLQADDLIVFDRNYTDYLLLAQLIQWQRHFVGRGRRSSFTAVRCRLDGWGPDSQVVTIRAPKRVRRRVRELGLPSEIRVRLVRLILPTGGVEVLITSLLDEAQLSIAELGQVYDWRWGEETFYGVLKTRLELEDFTGQSVEAVKQDFYAAVFITGLETFFTDEAQSRLKQRSSPNRHPQQVNKNVPFNAIKNQVLDLFYRETDETLILEQLTELFMQKPTMVRADRVVPRRRSPSRRLLHYHRRRKKICF